MATQTYKEMTYEYLTTRSEESFAMIYNRVKPGLTVHINKIVKDWDVAEDIAVTSLTKMWTKIDQYNPDYQITTWLYKIGFNAALGYLNERNKTRSLTALNGSGVEINTIGELGANGTTEDDPTISEMLEEDNNLQVKYNLTIRAIKTLKPMYRDLMVDRMLNGVKYKDLTKKHNISLQTVKNRVRRGKTLIAEKVEAQLYTV